MRRIIAHLIYSVILIISSIGCLQSEEIQPKPVPAQTPEGLFAQKVWEEEILVETRDAQKSPRILDNFEIVQGIEFYPHDDPSVSRRDSLLASVLITIGKLQAIDIHLTPYNFVEQAERIKGEPLTVKEIKIISDYAESIRFKPSNQKHSFPASYNPLLNNYLFAFYEVVSKCQTIDNVVQTMRTVNCVDLTYEMIDNAGFNLYKKAIDSNIPVLLEKDNEYYVGYGYIIKDGTPHIFYFDPKFVPALKAKPEFLISDLEDNNKGSLDFNHGGYEEGYYINYRLSNLIPQINVLEPFGRNQFIFHFFSSCRVSYDAHNEKIRALIGLKPQSTPVQITYPSKTASEDIWNKYFLNNTFQISGVSKLTPCTIIGGKNRINSETPGIYFALASAMDSVGAYSATEFGWHIGSLIRFTRRIMKKPFEYLPDNEVAELQKILDSKRNDIYYPTFQLNQERSSYYRAVIRLKNAIGVQSSLQMKSALEQIAKKTGWLATAEGTKNATYEQYCESIHKNIPILLFGPKDIDNNSQRWLICFGYYIENEKKYLVLADLSNIDGALLITKESFFPREGVFFEEYIPSRYVSYFIYHWELSDAGIRKELAEIVANHVKYIEDQNQSEIDEYWSIYISKDSSEKDKLCAIQELSSRKDTRLKEIVLEWLNDPNCSWDKMRIASGITASLPINDAIPLLRNKLNSNNEGMRNASYKNLIKIHELTDSIEVKKYIYNIRSDIIEAIKASKRYNSDNRGSYESARNEIKSIESWREDDPVAEHEIKKTKTNNPIDVQTNKIEPLYDNLQIK